MAASAEFLEAWRKTAEGADNLPQDPALTDALLDLFLLQKAIYEAGYELGMRPAWLGIPLQGLLDLLGDDA
nr:hypothetical protein [Cereibacter changlensis]